MKRLSAISFALCTCIAALFWVFYPTGIQSESGTFEKLTREEYLGIRKSAEEFARTVSPKGVEFYGGPASASSFEFTCKGVPLLLVDNSFILFRVHLMAGAERRSPEIMKFRELMVSRLKPSGQPGGPLGPPAVPRGIEAFVLKYRDDIDVSQQCD